MQAVQCEVLVANLLDQCIALLLDIYDLFAVAINLAAGITNTLGRAGSVALLTQRLLDQGWKFTALFTDLDNPTSNSIYRKIGYRKIGESKHIQLKPVAHAP